MTPILFDLALKELIDYALHQNRPDKIEFALVYRVIEEGERSYFLQQMINVLGVANFIASCETYDVGLGHCHVISSSAISHVITRHGEQAAETKQGHKPVTSSDLHKLPALIRPKNIVGFSNDSGRPRIIYELSDIRGTLVGIEEICRRGLYTKTMYWKK